DECRNREFTKWKSGKDRRIMSRMKEATRSGQQTTMKKHTHQAVMTLLSSFEGTRNQEPSKILTFKN
nr:hypothetical protein [Tanacetum cinerariifolium]